MSHYQALVISTLLKHWERRSPSDVRSWLTSLPRTLAIRTWSFLSEFMAARPSRFFDTRSSLSYIRMDAGSTYHACTLSAAYQPLKEEIVNKSKYCLPQRSASSGHVCWLGLFLGKFCLIQEMMGECEPTLTTSRYVSGCESCGNPTLTSFSKCEHSLQEDKKIVSMVNSSSHVDLQSR